MMETVFRLVSTLFGLWGCAAILFALYLPDAYRWIFRGGQRSVVSTWGDKLALTPAVLAFIGLAVLSYHAAGSLVALIPPDWGSTDDSGDWQSTRSYVQFLLSFLGAAGLVALIDRTYDSRFRSLDATLLHSLLKVLRTPYYNTANEVRAAVTSAVAGVLKDDPYAPDSVRAYKAELVREATYPTKE